ncbi:MAG: hypothetical protein AAGA57_06240 [Planctomycetota bacterium]
MSAGAPASGAGARRGAGASKGASSKEAKKSGRWWKIAALVVIGVSTVLGGLAVLGWSSKPSGWAEMNRRLEGMDAVQRATLAESVENRLVSAWATPSGAQTAEEYYAQVVAGEAGATPAAPQTVRVEIDELNAWLDVRLRKLVEHQGQAYPAWLHSVRVWTEGEELVLGVRVQRSEVDQVFSFALGFETPSDGGETVMRVEGARAGLLPVPLSQLAERLGSDKGSGRRATARKLLDDLQEGVAVGDWVSKLDPDRPVRVSAVRVSDGVIEVERQPVAGAGDPG